MPTNTVLKKILHAQFCTLNTRSSVVNPVWENALCWVDAEGRFVSKTIAGEAPQHIGDTIEIIVNRHDGHSYIQKEPPRRDV